MGTTNLFSKIRVREGDISLMSLTSPTVDTYFSDYVGYFDYNQVLSYIGIPNTAGATDISARFTYAYSHLNEEVNIISVDDNNKYYVVFTSTTHLDVYIKITTQYGSTQTYKVCAWDFQSLNPSRWGAVYLFIVQTSSYKTIGMYFIPDGGGNGWYFFGNKTYGTANNYSEQLINKITAAPTYVWTAWDQISGNSGQYRCNLTKINDDVIEDVSTHYQRGSDYFSRISQQSSIMSIIQNAALDVERPIAYSGNAKLTLEVKAGTQSVSRKLVYRFYQPDGTAPLYNLEQVIYLAGTTPTNDVLLMFVHDDNEQAAVFLPVEKVLYQGGLEQYIFGDISLTDTEMLYIWMWLQTSGAGEPEYPYDTGSTDNGGNPAGAQPGDHIGTPDVPTLGGMSTGMFTVYCPSDTQLTQIAQFLWSDNVLDNIKKYFNNFADNIIALYVLPCKPVSLPFKNFKVGNMQSDTITDVEYITQRFIQIDMGSVYIKNTFDSYLDYSPFTKFEIYLPGIGMQTLSADDIMCPTDPDTGELIENTEGSVISVKYNIDLMTGILVALVMINGELRYQFPGKIGYSIPLTGENYANIARGFVTAASGLIGAVATGGLSAPLTAGGVSAAVSGTVNAMKPEIHRGGNLTGDASMLGEKSPYLVYHRPNKPLLKNQERYTGFPSYKSGALSEFSGLTQVIDAHIEGISCTEAERAEILNLLKGGVIL